MATEQLTTLEKAIASALRLSASATQILLPEIQRNIQVAEAELIRSGVPESEILKADRPLVDEAVITYCLMNMGDEDKYELYFTAFTYQQDNLRKTKYEE